MPGEADTKTLFVFTLHLEMTGGVFLLNIHRNSI